MLKILAESYWLTPLHSSAVRRWVSKFKRYDDVHQAKASESEDLSLTNRPQEEYTFRFNGNINPRYSELALRQSSIVKKIPLKHLNIHYLPDTQDFSKIPTLKHGLNEHLDGKLVVGDKALGKLNDNVSQQFLQAISTYVKPSEDPKLLQLCKTHKYRYLSSTSNISTPLVHLYYIFSQFRRPYLKNILEEFDESRAHMVSFRKPVVFILKRLSKDIFSIDSEKQFLSQDNEVLMRMGTYLEYLLTNTTQKLDQDLKSSSQSLKSETYYRYAGVNNQILIRSQIDCTDVNPETGQNYVFEIKTRAACPIRYDVVNYKDYLDYPIDSIKGRFYSFEREYYDLIRGGLLKYAFQLKTGNMDGAFVTYHNTLKIFGYEYIPLKQIAYRLFGNEYNLELTYMCTNEMLYQTLEVLGKQFDRTEDLEQLKIGFYAHNSRRCLTVFVEKMIHDKTYPPLPLKYEQDVQTYFKKYHQLKNPVQRYQFQFFLYQNNILVESGDTFFEPTDSIRMEWKWVNKGKVMESDYINFLTDAYKIDNSFGIFNYGGVWSRSTENE